MVRRARLQSMMAWQASAASPDPLAIKDLRAYPLREPDSGRSFTMLRVESVNGLIGWGECGAAIPPSEMVAAKLDRKSVV